MVDSQVRELSIRLFSSLSTIFVGEADSLSLSILAITFPTSTTSFGFANISTTTPSAEEGISESTLSVPISRSISSNAIGSPTSFLHSKMVPSVMDSPILGITISIII